jgi:hypothetical protein
VFDQTFDPITINRTNSQGSIGCSIEHLIAFDHITINQTNSLGSIKCLIEHFIISRSIELIHYDRLNVWSII